MIGFKHLSLDKEQNSNDKRNLKNKLLNLFADYGFFYIGIENINVL